MATKAERSSTLKENSLNRKQLLQKVLENDTVSVACEAVCQRHSLTIPRKLHLQWNHIISNVMILGDDTVVISIRAGPCRGLILFNTELSVFTSYFKGIKFNMKFMNYNFTFKINVGSYKSHTV
jgi:hypothetical protein